MYKINLKDEEIVNIKKQKWKQIVNNFVTETALFSLNEECASQKKASNLGIYSKVQLQEYFSFLSPDEARLIFQIRTQIFDIKTWRKYKYSDEQCRLCGMDIEYINHILTL